MSGGPNPDPYNWTGDLYYKSNGQTLYGNYVAPGDAAVVGTLTVHFDDDIWRHTSSTALPSSACFKAKAIASLWTSLVDRQQ